MELRIHDVSLFRICSVNLTFTKIVDHNLNVIELFQLQFSIVTVIVLVLFNNALYLEYKIIIFVPLSIGYASYLHRTRV